MGKQKWANVQVTEQEAIEMGENKTWQDKTAEEIVMFQLFQRRLAMPLSLFHKSIETVLGRPVFTHELANRDSIVLEYLGCKDAPTMEEIINMVPADKRRIVLTKK